jgi:hypothetical protein
MFVVSEAEAAAIRTAFERGGELSAAVELRRLFPGVTDTAQARECARAIAAWKPLPAKPRSARQAALAADHTMGTESRVRSSPTCTGRGDLRARRFRLR